MRKRIGRFSISREFVDKNPEVVLAIMGRVIVVRCEMMYQHDELEYIALSPYFDELPPGMITPKYEVVISKDGACIGFKRSE